MDPTLVLREARAGDRPALRQVYRLARSVAFTWCHPARFAIEDFDRDTVGELILVAASARGPLGFVSLWLAGDFVHHLFVHPDVCGRGIGTALLRAGLARLGRPATLKCVERNQRARTFYLGRGWRIAERGTGPDGPYHLLRFDDA